MNEPARLQPAETKLSFGQIAWNASGRALFFAVALSLLYFVAKFVYTIYDTDSSVLVALGHAGQVFIAVWVLAFGLFLISSSRVWSDRAFTTAGFLATFLGLGILGVFFYQLAEDVGNFFHYTPILIEQSNKEHQHTLDIAKDLKKGLLDEIAQTEKQRDADLATAATDAEKKEIRELYDFGIEKLRKDLETSVEQKLTIAQRRLRPNRSPTSILAYFLSSPPDKDAQDSGIGPALWGSVYLGILTILFSVPIGVGAALYLEEYRQEGRLARLIQVNINNLAGVPSVVYGILGGFVFVYIFKKINAVHPDVDPFNLLGGGLTLGLLALPMIIVASQEAIRAVPSSLRHGAYALGATKWQAIWTLVLPQARAGILTGTILSLSRAIGEAAPLVLFGAQQYVDRNPSLFAKFTALPLQIYQWCGEPGIMIEGYEESIDIWKYNAAVASTVLLIVLLGLNGIAIVLRNRAQKKLN